MEQSGPVQACNGIALPLPLPIRWIKQSRRNFGMEICDESKRRLQQKAVIQSLYQVKNFSPFVIDIC